MPFSKQQIMQKSRYWYSPTAFLAQQTGHYNGKFLLIFYEVYTVDSCFQVFSRRINR